MNGKGVSVWSKDTFIYAEVYGTGRPLLLLHGNGEDHQILEHQIRYFSSYRQVIAMDTRGHGKSGIGKQRLTFKQIASDIIRLLDYLKISNVQVIGFSDGGNIALYMARQYPERMNEMVVVGANYDPTGMRPDILEETNLTHHLQTLMGSFSQTFRKKAAVTNLMLKELNLKESDLMEIYQPVLVVAGENDMILDGHTHALANLLPNSGVTIVADATHFLMMENPDEFNQIAATFLEGISDAKNKKEQTR